QRPLTRARGRSRLIALGCSVAAPWDERLLDYDFGPSHPLNPVRVELTMALARELGVLEQLDPTPFQVADDDVLRLVHPGGYLDAVKVAGETLRPDPAHGLGTPDDPVFPSMHEASALVAGASIAAVSAVFDATHDHAVNISGGLHHAMPDRASGF